MHFADIDNFYHEWEIDSLPWDVVVPVAVGEEHPEVLDQKLVDAIHDGPLRELGEDRKHARAASVAFLYMYLMLSKGNDRCVYAPHHHNEAYTQSYRNV